MVARENGFWQATTKGFVTMATVTPSSVTAAAVVTSSWLAGENRVDVCGGFESADGTARDSFQVGNYLPISPLNSEHLLSSFAPVSRV